MKIEHIALWVEDVEKVCEFYEKYFGAAVSSPAYHNPKRGFTSRFLSFDGAGTRIEVMNVPDLLPLAGENALGLTHFAMSVGSRENVDALTERLRKDGYTILGEPRTTGDEYYESKVLDLEGNVIEITV